MPFCYVEFNATPGVIIKLLPKSGIPSTTLILERELQKNRYQLGVPVDR